MKEIKDKLVDKLVILVAVYTIGVLLAVLFNLFRVLKRIRILHWERFPDYRCNPELYKNGLIVVSNHPSLLEPILLPALFWKEYLLHPIQLSPWSTPDKTNYYDKWYLFWLRPVAIPINRNNQWEARRSFFSMKRILSSGRILIGFPEGGRTSSSQSNDFFYSPIKKKKLRILKEGFGLLIKKTNPLVLPVWVDDAEKIIPNVAGRLYSFPRLWNKVTIKIGTPLNFGNDKSREEICQKLATILLNLADEEE